MPQRWNLRDGEILMAPPLPGGAISLLTETSIVLIAASEVRPATLSFPLTATVL